MKRFALGALVVFLFFLFSLATAPFLIQAPRLLSGAADLAREETFVLLDGQRLSVLVADSASTRERGLGGRDSIEPADGMLFVFPNDGRYAIWMKDMRFSIDILWINSSGTVVDMRTNVRPDSYPEIFEPAAASRFILELPAGNAERLGVRIGSMASVQHPDGPSDTR